MTAPAAPAPSGAPILRVITRAPYPDGAQRPTRGLPPDPLFAALDAVGQALGVIAPNGAVLRQTVAFDRLLTDHADRGRIVRLTQAAVNEIVARGVMPRRWTAVEDHACLRDGDWIVRASLYRPADGAMVLVHIERERAAAEAVSDDELCRRFGLTPTEVRVARLLADGQTNKTVAATIGISGHTARHHTEHVMRKLGIRSRNAVARTIARPAEPGLEGFGIQGS